MASLVESAHRLLCAIEKDQEIRFQRYVNQKGIHSKEKIFQYFPILLNNKSFNILVFNQDQVHIFEILHIIFGFEDAKLFYFKYYTQENAMVFFRFVDFYLKHSLEKIPLDELALKPKVDEFFANQTLSEINRQTGFKFTKTFLGDVIFSAIDGITDEICDYFHGHLDDISEAENEMLTSYVNTTLRRECKRYCEKVKKTLNFSEIQKSKREREEKQQLKAQEAKRQHTG